MRTTSVNAKTLLLTTYGNMNRRGRMSICKQWLWKVLGQNILVVWDALHTSSDIIIKYALQGLLSHQFEGAKMEYLDNAVSCFGSAKILLIQRFTHSSPWNFHQNFTGWDTTWLQERRQCISSSNVHDDASKILWESQRMYGDPRPKPSFNDRERFMRSNDILKILCYNCNVPGHFS